MKKKPNPADTTFRNHRAHAKRIAKLEAKVKELDGIVARLVKASVG